MEIATERIDLGEGQWADMFTEVKRVTARLHEAEIRKHLRPVDDRPLAFSDVLSGAREWPKDYLINPAAVDHGLVAEVYALHQVKAWSFGPVTQETLDNMPKRFFELLRNDIDERYQADPLQGAAQTAG